MECKSCNQPWSPPGDVAPIIDDAALSTPEKPRPIRVGVQGVSAAQFGGGESPSRRPPPDVIARLPPFGMFAAEKVRASSGHVAELQLQRLANDPHALDEYERWHAAKKLWPLETAYGELRGGR